MLLLALLLGFRQDVFRIQTDSKPREISFENPTGRPGAGGTENRGAKGHAMETIQAGRACTLMDVAGTGVVRSIWLTVSNRDPAALRGMKLEMYWDGSSKPAVAAPVGDFFGTALAMRTPFECAFFSDPEGRSFNCTIPMPFRSHARIVFTNESAGATLLFYSISYTEEKALPSDAGYLHAYWHRQVSHPLGEEYEILPSVAGKGRFLGDNVGVIANPAYGHSWFGEGEVKMYLDGDGRFPTLVGTGTEDYVGSAWGLGKFSGSAYGCTVADGKSERYAFYRFHLADPVVFASGCRVTLQEIGGDSLESVRKLSASGTKIVPVSVQAGSRFVKLLERPIPLGDASFPDGWVNFFRSDDYSSTAYFYLDRPSNDLPPLAPAKERMLGMPSR
jgi:hypothetical protein